MSNSYTSDRVAEQTETDQDESSEIEPPTPVETQPNIVDSQTEFADDSILEDVREFLGYIVRNGKTINVLAGPSNAELLLNAKQESLQEKMADHLYEISIKGGPQMAGGSQLEATAVLELEGQQTVLEVNYLRSMPRLRGASIESYSLIVRPDNIAPGEFIPTFKKKVEMGVHQLESFYVTDPDGQEVLISRLGRNTENNQIDFRTRYYRLPTDLKQIAVHTKTDFNEPIDGEYKNSIYVSELSWLRDGSDLTPSPEIQLTDCQNQVKLKDVQGFLRELIRNPQGVDLLAGQSDIEELLEEKDTDYDEKIKEIIANNKSLSVDDFSKNSAEEFSAPIMVKLDGSAALRLSRNLQPDLSINISDVEIFAQRKSALDQTKYSTYLKRTKRESDLPKESFYLFVMGDNVIEDTTLWYCSDGQLGSRQRSYVDDQYNLAAQITVDINREDGRPNQNSLYVGDLLWLAGL